MMSILSLLFSFKGRIDRKLYWLALLGVLLLLWLFVALRAGELTLLPLFSILALQTRRCRDIGWSPWLVLISLVPMLMIIFMINVGIPQSLLALMPLLQVLFMIVVGIPKSRILYPGNGFHQQGYALNNNRFRIIQCASCRTKIRVAFPPPAGVGKCPLCQHRFVLKVDEYGNLTVYSQGGAGYPESDLNEIATSAEAFKILGVEGNPDQLTIRKAYKAKMGRYHPDKVSLLGIEIRELADRKSKQINEAYRFLRHNK
jgi:uncharacterized membrane protein YhaH (DUF805 family)